MNTNTITKCNHSFCIAKGKTSEAVANVSYHIPAGPYSKTTDDILISWNVCVADLPALLEMVIHRNKPYTVTVL